MSVQGPVLGGLAEQMRENSERWFPRWHSPDLGMPLTVAYALGLAGEVGEVANVVKKMQRDGHDGGGEGIGAELADVFTYLVLLADECGVDLVAEYRAKVKVNEARWGRVTAPRGVEAVRFDPRYEPSTPKPGDVMDDCEVPGCDRPARIIRHQRSGDALRVCGEPHVYPSTCPTCGYAGREANVYRKGELWSSCNDPWHVATAPSRAPEEKP